MSRAFIRTAAFLTGLALLLTLLGQMYQPKDNIVGNGINALKANGFLAYEPEELDAVFIGCSLFYRCVDPLQIWGEQGITSYNISSSAQRCYEDDRYLHMVLGRLRPKVILLDGYSIVRPGFADDAVFTSCSVAFPVLQYHNNWKRYDLSTVLQAPEYTNRVKQKGYRPAGGVTPITWGDYMDPTDERDEMPLLNRLYLAHMAAVCRRAGVELAIVTPPSPANWDMATHNALQADADWLGIPLYDLNLELETLGMDPEKDFLDPGDHLNVDGAEKVNCWLGELLARRYGLPDHREDPDYAHWQWEYQKYG